jgi:hypothetical protein
MLRGVIWPSIFASAQRYPARGDGHSESIVVYSFEFVAQVPEHNFRSYTFTAASMHSINSFISNGFWSKHAAPTAAALASRFESERAVINTTGVVEPRAARRFIRSSPLIPGM